MHLLAPYYSKLVLSRLKDTYCSPQVEMKWDTEFFKICTVSPRQCTFKKQNLWDFYFTFNLLAFWQEFTLSVIPFVFETSLESDTIPFGWQGTHFLLEEFFSPYYYNKEWYSHLSELLEAGRCFRACALSKTERKLFKEMLSHVCLLIPLTFPSSLSVIITKLSVPKTFNRKTKGKTQFVILQSWLSLHSSNMFPDTAIQDQLLLISKPSSFRNFLCHCNYNLMLKSGLHFWWTPSLKNRLPCR